jgi:hypothetical protein
MAPEIVKLQGISLADLFDKRTGELQGVVVSVPTGNEQGVGTSEVRGYRDDRPYQPPLLSGAFGRTFKVHLIQVQAPVKAARLAARGKINKPISITPGGEPQGDRLKAMPELRDQPGPAAVMSKLTGYLHRDVTGGVTIL